MIPYLASSTTPQVPDEQGYVPADYFRLMMTAASKAKTLGFGADGTIERCIEIVRGDQLYVDPAIERLVTFTPEEIARCAASLRERGQITPIFVLKVPNPHSDFPTHPEQLLIVDFDGMLLWRAASAAELQDYRVVILPFAGNYAQELIDAVARKSRQVGLRPLILGRMVNHIIEVHHLEFPNEAALTLEGIAADLGYVAEGHYSVSHLSRCADLAAQPEPIVRLVDGNQVTLDQLREILPMPEPQRIAYAQQLAERNQQDGPVPRARIRAEKTIQLTPEPPPPFVAPQEINCLDLWSFQNDETQAPAQLVLGMLLHDIGYVLEQLHLDKPAPFVKQINKLLALPEAQRLIAQRIVAEA